MARCVGFPRRMGILDIKHLSMQHHHACRRLDPPEASVMEAVGDPNCSKTQTVPVQCHMMG